jgi:hypothetical protein
MSSVEQGVTRGFSMSLLLITTVGAFLLASCQGRVRSDDELAAAFSSNEQSFDAIASTYTAGRVLCPHRNYPDDCVLSGADEVGGRLVGDRLVQVIYVKRNRGGDDGVWMPVESYGALSISSSTRGYVYLDNPPSTLVKDTLDPGTNGSYYKPFKGNWYLFVAN